MDYLRANQDYWEKGYDAENVESFVFRVYGRVFNAQFGIDGSNGEKLLDFGCGSGAALAFFARKGFDVYGVDISPVDIQRCRDRMPGIAEHFTVIDPQPNADDVFFGGGYDLVIAVQSLYYFSDADLKTRLQSIYDQMTTGALVYATMMGTKCARFFDNSTDWGDGLRKVDFSTGRLQVKDYFVNFTEDERDLAEKFKMFRSVHIGYYDECYRDEEGSGFHYTFIGAKE